MCELRRSALREKNNGRNKSYNAGGQHIRWCCEVDVFSQVGTVRGDKHPLNASLYCVPGKKDFCDRKQPKISTGQPILSDIHTQGVPDYGKGVLKGILSFL